MRISIDSLQKPGSISKINVASGAKIIGGDSINASVNIVASSDGAIARSRAGVFGSGIKMFGSFMVANQTGEKDGIVFSRSFSSSIASAG